MKLSKIVVTVVLLVVLLVPSVAYASDGLETVDHNVVSALIVNTVVGLIVSAFGSSPITTVLVSVLKKVRWFDRLSGKDLNFLVSAVLYVGALIASYAGFSEQFNSVLDLVVAVAPPFVAFITNMTVSTAIYHTAKALEVPIVGESRN